MNWQKNIESYDGEEYPLEGSEQRTRSKGCKTRRAFKAKTAPERV